MTALVTHALALFLVAFPGQAPPPPGQAPPAEALTGDPAGFWLTEEETAVVRIERCDEGLCGWIHWIDEGGRTVDDLNLDRSLRTRPLCGLRILSGFEQNPGNPAEWRGGEVYAADDGRTYSARIRMEAPDRMDLRGYRGITLLGRSQAWVRVPGDEYPRCEPSAGG